MKCTSVSTALDPNHCVYYPIKFLNLLKPASSFFYDAQQPHLHVPDAPSCVNVTELAVMRIIPNVTDAIILTDFA